MGGGERPFTSALLLKQERCTNLGALDRRSLPDGRRVGLVLRNTPFLFLSFSSATTKSIFILTRIACRRMAIYVKICS